MATHFVQILQADHRHAWTRAWVAAGVALLLGVAAYFVYGGWPGIVIHAGGALLGAQLGWVLARRLTANYEASIRGTWTQWMRYAVACETLPEVYRKVRGRSGRNLPFLYAAILTGLWALEVLLLVLAFQGSGAAHAWDIPVIAANGIGAGALAAHAWYLWRWYGQFKHSVSELVDSGEIGVWGVL